MKERFDVGETYFQLGFLDKEFRYPIITSLVYIGKNLEGKGHGDLWFFQDPESYLKSGSYSGSGKEAVRTAGVSQKVVGQVITFGDDTISEILPIDQLIEELSQYAKSPIAWRRRGL